MKKDNTRKLAFLRGKIDLLDKKICGLLEKRLKIAIKTSVHKKKSRDIKREEEILSKIKKNLENKSFYLQVRNVYTEIFRQSLVLQRKYVDKIRKKRFKK